MKTNDGTTVDPVRHIQEVAKQLGLYDQLVYTFRFDEYLFARLLTMRNPIRRRERIEVSFCYRAGETQEERDRWSQYLRGARAVHNSKEFTEIDLMRDDLSSFGEFKRGIDVDLKVFAPKKMLKTLWVECQIEQSHGMQRTEGTFLMKRTPRRMGKEDKERFGYHQILDMHGRDYRSYVHRMFEIYAEVPPEKRHDPAIYLQKDEAKQATALETLVDDGIMLLFSGIQRGELLERIQKARLQTRRYWASIPKLNLGEIELPPIGAGDVTKDEFVTAATPYIIEELARLGIMNQSAAEKMMMRKLVHYFIHSGGFQLSEARARELIQRLQPVRSENEVDLKRTTL